MGTDEEQKFSSGVGEAVESSRNNQPHVGEETERPTTYRRMDPGLEKQISFSNVLKKTRHCFSAVLFCFVLFSEGNDYCQPLFSLGLLRINLNIFTADITGAPKS